MTAKEYVASYVPRVPGLQYTAPVYDELTKPSRVPVPAACVQIRGGCECWTQQGTHLETTQQICDQVVKRGYFEAFDADGRAPKNQERVQVVQQPASAPAVEPQEVRWCLTRPRLQKRPRSLANGPWWGRAGRAVLMS